MEGLRRSKRLRSHDVPGDGSQENKGEALHALTDDDSSDDEEDVVGDHVRPRKSATEGTFSLADLNRLALKPGLTAKELANGFWNLQGRLEEDPDDPERKELNDTFVKNIILGRNLEVFLEVDKSLSFGMGIILQLMFAAVRAGDENAVVRLVSLLHRRRYTMLFGALEEALRIDLPYEAPHSGARGLVKEIVRLKVVKPGKKAVTSYSCKNFIENFNVLSCSKQALIAIDEVLGPQVWDEARFDKKIAAEEWRVNYAQLARSGILEYLLRHNALVLTSKLCSEVSRCVRTPALYTDSPHILSLVDDCIKAGFPILETEESKVRDMLLLSRICDYLSNGQVDQLHSLLELCIPAERSCTPREDGLLDEPRPPPHIVKKRAEMVFDALCKRGTGHPMRTHAGLPLQHYLFHELQLDVGRVSKYCDFRVIFLGPTSPPALVDEVLRLVHANLPKLDIDKWKELFKQDVYPVPAYYGDQDIDIVDKFHNSLAFVRTSRDTNVVYSIRPVMTRTHETLEYLRPWFRVFSETLCEKTKLSMDEAVDLCSGSDFRAQAMVEADMIRISQKEGLLVHLPRVSKNLFPIYLKWYEHTKDRELTQVLQVVLFATACAANRISEAKQVLLNMLQPPSGQDLWAKVSSRRANLLTMAACTRNLPSVKWVFSQIQAAFPLEPSEKLKDLDHVSGPDRTKIEWRKHQLTISAWLDLMTSLIPSDRFRDWSGLVCPKIVLQDPFSYLTSRVLYPPCPKYLLETGLLLAQMDPLAVLPLISRIVIMKQQNIGFWCNKFSFYDTPAVVYCYYDYVNKKLEEYEVT